MASKTKSISAFLLVAVLLLGSFGVFVSIANSKTPETKGSFDFVEVAESDGKLSAEQIRQLNNGAMITYNGEIYQLSQINEEHIYAYNDTDNIFIRKYIGVNTEDGFYHSWEKTNDELVTKALLNSALSDYATDNDVNNALNSALVEYLTNEEVKKTLNAALVNYVKGADMGTILADYASKDAIAKSLSDITASLDSINLRLNHSVTERSLKNGESLAFEKNTIYVVYCMDSKYDLVDFKLVGGDKDGTTGRMAFAFIGNDFVNSTVFYQTGSVLVSNLVATSGGSTGIRPANESSFLFYFKILGKSK